MDSLAKPVKLQMCLSTEDPAGSMSTVDQASHSAGPMCLEWHRRWFQIGACNSLNDTEPPNEPFSMTGRIRNQPFRPKNTRLSAENSHDHRRHALVFRLCWEVTFR